MDGSKYGDEIRELPELSSRLLTRRAELQSKDFEPFSDVPSGHWAAKAANELKLEGLLAGYPGVRPALSLPLALEYER